ncbi:chromobox protein homolog 1-like [Adelges cooleyi]|uniref:chromobox protein homolog 1-like n=1 Tax=Adelges cooleyi TaxID=133065 RepID=UPI00217FFB99|nr:chromobox protein homolog 1-like [Adelges cooleyi]
MADHRSVEITHGARSSTVGSPAEQEDNRNTPDSCRGRGVKRSYGSDEPASKRPKTDRFDFEEVDTSDHQSDQPSADENDSGSKICVDYSSDDETTNDIENKEEEAADSYVGHEPEEVFGMKNDSNGGLMYLLKWKHADYINFVPARVVKVLSPKIVLKFYEKCLGLDYS